jgi:hypothetical protein
MIKGELFYSFFEVKTDLSHTSVDGGIGSMQKRMTQNYEGVRVPTGIQY